VVPRVALSARYPSGTDEADHVAPWFAVEPGCFSSIKLVGPQPTGIVNGELLAEFAQCGPTRTGYVQQRVVTMAQQVMESCSTREARLGARSGVERINKRRKGHIAPVGVGQPGDLLHGGVTEAGLTRQREPLRQRHAVPMMIPVEAMGAAHFRRSLAALRQHHRPAPRRASIPG